MSRQGPIGFMFAWFLVVALAELPRPARAANLMTEEKPSIEWLCECKRHIAVARLQSWEKLTSSYDWSGVVRTVAVLKGHPPQTARVSCILDPPDPRRRHEFLLTFDDSLRVDYAVSLTDSDWCELPFSMHCTVLAPGEIVNAARRRLKRMNREGRGKPGTLSETNDRQRFLRFPIPGWREPCDMGDCFALGTEVDFVLVPADSEWRTVQVRLLHHSHPHVRAAAALGLGFYPGRATVESLRVMLQDTARESVEVSRHPPRFVTFYPVREAAYRSLMRLGAEVRPPDGLVQGELEAWVVQDLIESYQGAR